MLGFWHVSIFLLLNRLLWLILPMHLPLHFLIIFPCGHFPRASFTNDGKPWFLGILSWRCLGLVFLLIVNWLLFSCYLHLRIQLCISLTDELHIPLHYWLCLNVKCCACSILSPFGLASMTTTLHPLLLIDPSTYICHLVFSPWLRLSVNSTTNSTNTCALIVLARRKVILCSLS